MKASKIKSSSGTDQDEPLFFACNVTIVAGISAIIQT